MSGGDRGAWRVELVTDRARKLIAEHITSVEQLEILILLRGERIAWTVEQINDRIKSSLSSIRMRLADLEAHRFVRRSEEGYRYVPNPAEEMAVDELATAYEASRYAVIDLIFAKPTDKLSIFSRAFRLRRDDDG